MERLILRCLEKDPAARPASALAVAAALPGGDPLAAMVAAGETPPPEMVAAAGPRGALRPAIAWACLAFVALAVPAVLLIEAPMVLLSQVPLDKLPQVLAEHAAGTLRALGHQTQAAASACGFEYDRAVLGYLTEQLPPETWGDTLNRARPAAVRFWYRIADAPMRPLRPRWRWSRARPPETCRR